MYRDPHRGRRAMLALVALQILFVVGLWAMSRVPGVDSMLLVLGATSLLCGAALWHLTKP